jgi:hypothetical protein
MMTAVVDYYSVSSTSGGRSRFGIVAVPRFSLFSPVQFQGYG